MSVEIKCPYCNKGRSFEVEDLPLSEDDEFEETCLFCDKSFIIALDVAFSWHSSKNEDDE